MPRWMLCFSKIDQQRRQRRRYTLWMQRNLFNGWSVMAAWGPLGAAGGSQACVADQLTLGQAAQALVRCATHRLRRGYLLSGTGVAVNVTVGVGAGLAAAAGASMSTCRGEALGSGVAVPLGWSSGQAVANMATMAAAQARTNRFIISSVGEIQLNASRQQI